MTSLRFPVNPFVNCTSGELVVRFGCLKKERFRESQVSLASEMSRVELDGLRAAATSLEVEGRILEVGTAAGGTFIEWYRAFPNPGQRSFGVVDTFAYFPDQLEKWRSNLRSHEIDPETIERFECTSAEALKRFRQREEAIAFLLLDAGHKLKDVIYDLQWLQLIAVGGLAAFHDYQPKFPGVQIAVDDFLQRNSHYEIVSQHESLLIVRKTAESKGVEVPSSSSRG